MTSAEQYLEYRTYIGFRENSMIVSLYREKAPDKVQHPFMMKTLKKGVEGAHLNIVKAIYDKSIVNN